MVYVIDYSAFTKASYIYTQSSKYKAIQNMIRDQQEKKKLEKKLPQMQVHLFILFFFQFLSHRSSFYSDQILLPAFFLDAFSLHFAFFVCCKTHQATLQNVCCIILIRIRSLLLFIPEFFLCVHGCRSTGRDLHDNDDNNNGSDGYSLVI